MSSTLSVGFVGVSRYSRSHPRGDGRLDLLVVAGVDELDGDADVRQEVDEHLVGAAVGVLHRDDAVAGAQQREEAVADGGHARGEAGGRLPALQHPHLLLERVRRSGWCCGCRCGPAPCRCATSSQRVDVRVAVGGAVHHGHLCRALDEVRLFPGPDRLRLAGRSVRIDPRPGRVRHAGPPRPWSACARVYRSTKRGLTLTLRQGYPRSRGRRDETHRRRGGAARARQRAHPAPLRPSRARWSLRAAARRATACTPRPDLARLQQVMLYRELGLGLARSRNSWRPRTSSAPRRSRDSALCWRPAGSDSAIDHAGRHHPGYTERRATDDARGAVRGVRGLRPGRPRG